MLRTLNEKQEILNRLQPSKHHANVVTEQLRSLLLETFHNSPNKVKKNTGPVVLDWAPERHEREPWVEAVDDLVKKYLGDCNIYFMNFFDVSIPHIIHNDDSVKKKPRMHRNLVIPLWIDKNIDTNFAVFDQCYLDGPIKVRTGKREAENRNHASPQVYYNQDITDNSLLHFYTNKQFDYELYEQYFTHQPYKRFYGLSIESINRWRPGDLIEFDGARIHCAGDFLKQGIKRKIGLSIFTCI